MWTRDRWTSADSLHPLSCHAEDHQHGRKTGVCGGDIESYVYYSVPVLKADNILRRGLVQPFIWDQTRYISAFSFSVTSPSLCPGGSLRDHRGESHSLKSARASSRPGNNGEAYPSGSPQGYQRGESHSLTSARGSSRPGTNGEARSYSHR